MSADLFAEPHAAPPSCPACVAWSENPRSGATVASCDECGARELAQSPAAWKYITAGTSVDLRQATLRRFGDENYARGRALVLAWIERLKIGKGRA